MMRAIYLVPLLALAACATPQEQCISAVNRDLRVVEGLIETARGNLARGYAIEERTVLVNTQQVCGKTPKGKDILCDVATSEEKRVPVAIDLDAEQRKLDSLRARRAELLANRDRAISQCLARYPS